MAGFRWLVSSLLFQVHCSGLETSHLTL